MADTDQGGEIQGFRCLETGVSIGRRGPGCQWPECGGVQHFREQLPAYRRRTFQLAASLCSPLPEPCGIQQGPVERNTMKKIKNSLTFVNLPKDYRRLCDLCLPRPIHDEVGYENALEVAEAMAGFENRFTRDQADYFELLTDLILDYEQEHEKAFPEKGLPLRTRLRNLLESAHWSASDLGRFLGLDATMGNKIVRGERKLTTDHVRKLSAHFSLNAEYFL
jgi:HTH-type transcriptional regulator / antitoxin HigA